MKRFALSTFVMIFSCISAVFAQKTVVWEKPLSAFNRMSQRLSISKVVFCDTATVLTFHFEFPAGQQVGFPSETMLQADGKDYKAKGIRDYQLNVGITIPQSGKLDLDMICISIIRMFSRLL